MASGHIKNVKISAISCAVPMDKLTAEDFYEYVDKSSVDRFVKEAGVKQKYYSKNRKTITSDLCYKAAQKIIEEKNIDKESIDALIFISQTPDYVAPATACTLQYRLGLSENCMAYDVNLGCSAYVYGLQLAASHLQNGIFKRVLLLVGDALDGVCSTPNLNDLLFGDCGSATLIEYEKNAPGFRFELQTMGSGFKALGAICGLRYAYINHPPFDPSMNMNGLEVFTFSITKTPKLFKSFLKRFEASIEDYDAVLLHQANKSMLDVIIKKIKADKSKTPFSLDKYGNTSSATIPNLICDYYGKNNSDKQEFVIMSGFGIGLSLGVLDAYIKPSDIFSIEHTDETWDEGRSKLENIP